MSNRQNGSEQILKLPFIFVNYNCKAFNKIFNARPSFQLICKLFKNTTYNAFYKIRKWNARTIKFFQIPPERIAQKGAVHSRREKNFTKKFSCTWFSRGLGRKIGPRRVPCMPPPPIGSEEDLSGGRQRRGDTQCFDALRSESFKQCCKRFMVWINLNFTQCRLVCFMIMTHLQIN